MSGVSVATSRSTTVLTLFLLSTAALSIALFWGSAEAREGFDAELSFHPDEEPTHWIRPSRPWSGQVLLRNPNDTTDGYRFAIEASRSDFEATVEPGEAEAVGPEGTVLLNVTVLAPVDAPVSTYLYLNLTATSVDHGYCASLEWYLYVVRIKEVAVRPELGFLYIEPADQEVTLNMTLENVGDEVVDLHVQAQTFCGDEEVVSGVTVTFNETDVRLGPGGTRVTSMRIWVVDGPPIGSETGYRTRVQVVDVDGTTNSWYGEVKWTVRTRFRFTLDPPFSTVLTALQGQCSTFQLEFSQDTNDLRGHRWSIVFPTPVDDWTMVSPVISDHVLTGEENLTIDYIVRPDATVRAGDRWDLTISFVCENNPLLSFKATYFFVAEEYRDVVMTVTPVEVSCSPGEGVLISVDVENRGNVPEPLFMRVGLRNESYSRFELDATFDLTGTPLLPGSSRRFGVTATTSPLTTPGPNIVVVSCVWAGREDVVNVTLVVDEVIELVGLGPSTGPILVNPNEGTRTIDYQLWNRGNVALFTIVDVHVKPVASGVVVAPDLLEPDRTVMILPGNRLDLRFNVSTDGRSEFDFDVEGEMTLGFLTRDGNVLAMEVLEFTIVAPDLTIRDAEVVSEVKRGEQVVVQVWVRNGGSGASVPTSVTVIGARDEGMDHRVPAPALQPGEEAMVEVRFVVYGGTNHYQLLVDPEGILIEDGTMSNERLLRIEEGKDGEGEEGASPSYLPFGILATVVAIGMMVLVLGRRSRGDA